MTHRRTIIALLLGNFITGSAVLAPAGMLGEIARDVGIDIATAGLLISLGAVVLCCCSPLMTWLTARMERRTLLAWVIGLVSASHLLAAIAPSWAALLTIRLAAMAVAAVFTPQAASTLTLIVRQEERAAAIATAFLGWSIALAFGVPLVSMIASNIGWRPAYAVLGLLGFATAGVVFISVPRNLTGSGISLDSWKAILTSRTLLWILAVTILTSAGQFLLLTYLKPILTSLTRSSASRIAMDLVIFGSMSIAGNIAATRVVPRFGPYRTALLSFCSICSGMLVLFLGFSSPAAVTGGLMLWGLGFAASNSMQQARLAGAAPSLTGASIALNTSSIYIGQAAGASVGGLMVGSGLLPGTFLAAAALVAGAILCAVVSAHRPALPGRRISEAPDAHP